MECLFKKAQPKPSLIMMSERIFGFVSFLLVETYLLCSKIAEDFKQSLSMMSEADSSMVREAVLDKDMAIEPCHLWNGKDADGAKGTGLHRKHLSLGHIGKKMII